jgi:Tfp pilus assembly protein PilP
MHKIMILILLPLLAYASYNPFFTPHKPKVRQKVTKVNVRQVVKKLDVRVNLGISYFAFLETNKGKFALVDFAGKTIVIRQGDSLYSGNNKYKVTRLTSNYLYITGNGYSVQKVYFTSKGK